MSGKAGGRQRRPRTAISPKKKIKAADEPTDKEGDIPEAEEGEEGEEGEGEKRRKPTPKAKGKGKPKAKAEAQQQVAAQAEELKVDIANAKHLSVVQDNVKVIMACREFKDIISADPLPIGQGGTRMPFNLADYRKAMKDEGMYECGDNFWRHALGYSARARIPMQVARVKTLRDEKFAEPCAFPLELEISVASADWDPTMHYGAWMTTTPEEYRHAWAEAILRDVKERDPAKLKLWRKFSLTTKTTFRIHSSELERYYSATQYREDLADKFALTKITLMQRIFEIVIFKDSRARAIGRSIIDITVAYHSHPDHHHMAHHGMTSPLAHGTSKYTCGAIA